MEQKEQTKCMGSDGMQKMNGVINACLLYTSELPYGLYVVEESTVPENLKAIDPFLVKVDEDRCV